MALFNQLRMVTGIPRLSGADHDEITRTGYLPFGIGSGLSISRATRSSTTAYPHPSALRECHSAFCLLGCVGLIFQPIPKPAVNDLPLLVVNRTEIEKIRLFFL